MKREDVEIATSGCAHLAFTGTLSIFALVMIGGIAAFFTALFIDRAKCVETVSISTTTTKSCHASATLVVDEGRVRCVCPHAEVE